MAPSAKELQEALMDGTVHVFNAEPDATSVNKVRRHVEQKLGLEDGFLISGEWKQKSKALIKECVDKLLDGWVPEPKKEEPDSKSGIKRQSSEAESPEPKRRKRASQSAKPVKKESDVSESDKKPRAKKAARRKSRVAEPDGPRTFKSSPSPSKKRKRAIKHESEEETKDMKRNESEDDEVKRADSSDEGKPVKKQADSDDDTKPSVKAEETKPVIDEEQEYSDVIDEPPHPKRSKTEKKDSSSKASKSAPKKASAAGPEDANEAEIKKLQSQLVKCGIRKLWHNELKRYGNDARAKIRHLKEMLADVGMEGRFSEAKAREIRETRELMAEAEAAQEMNRLWGMGGGGRASRSKSKSMKLEESDGSGGDGSGRADGDDDDEGSNTFAARRRRAQADLAFLGDDGESD